MSHPNTARVTGASDAIAPCTDPLACRGQDLIPVRFDDPHLPMRPSSSSAHVAERYLKVGDAA